MTWKRNPIHLGDMVVPVGSDAVPGKVIGTMTLGPIDAGGEIKHSVCVLWPDATVVQWIDVAFLSVVAKAPK